MIPTLNEINGLTSGARISPGFEPGIAGVLNTNQFSLAGTARLTIEIGGTAIGGNTAAGYDQISILSPTTSATVSNGVLDLVDLTTGPLPPDALLFILVNHGTGGPSGAFGGVTLGGSNVPNRTNIVIGGQRFSLVNTANFDGISGVYGGFASGGNDVALVAVPEPATVLTLLGGTATLLGLQRSRRRGV
jgi:hypothetical protein